MDLKSPKSEPANSFEKPKTEKAEKTEISSKPTQKPNDKPRNKIESSKIDIKKEPRNKIQRERIELITPPRNKIERPKFDPTAPTRNKIEPRIIDPKKEPKHRIQPRVIDPKAPPRHKIEYPKFDINRKPKNKIEYSNIDHLTPPRNKIEYPTFDSSREPINKIQHQCFDTNKPNIDKIQVNPSHTINVKEIDENRIIKSFPKKSRNIICEEMYRNLNEKKRISNSKIVDTLIKDLKDNKSYLRWINKLPVAEFEELRNKLAKDNINNEFEGSLLKYFGELTNLVKDLRSLNKENQAINFSELSRNLIKQNRGLNLTKRGLEEAISGVYNHIKNNFDDFKLERAKRKAILGTESEKESIRCLKKEYKLLIEMNDGNYGGKCSNPSCLTDFTRLPAFDFHHEDPTIKTTTWSEIMHKKYDEIKNILEAQKVKPICKNCHLPDNAKIFNNFKGIILKKDLFTYSSKDIDKIINLKLNKFVKENNTNYTVASLKLEVKRWIKKRSVIEQVFNGKCISCGEDRLPSLQTHHTNQNLKVHEWGDVSRKWNIKKLINEYIIEEECVCLCGNCHAMINTKNFENNIEEVLGEKYVQEVEADYNKINGAIMKNANRIKKIKKGLIKLDVKDHLNED